MMKRPPRRPCGFPASGPIATLSSAIIAIFVYVGAEVSIGSFLINYLNQPDIGNLPQKTAALYVAFYWGGAMVGRFCGAGITQKLRAGPVLGVAAIVAGCLVITPC